MNSSVWGHMASPPAPTGVNGWARLLGVSLRPWSGLSPVSLIARGIIRAALCVFFIVVVLRFSSADELSQLAGTSGGIRVLAIIVAAALLLGALTGVVSVVAGAIDLVSRRTVHGTVVSVTDRKTLDFLPRFAQQMLFERNTNRIDTRRSRTEVVLSTDAGDRQWTVRKRAVLRNLHPGTHVALTVTPIAGYVSQVDQAQPTTPSVP